MLISSPILRYSPTNFPRSLQTISLQKPNKTQNNHEKLSPYIQIYFKTNYCLIFSNFCFVWRRLHWEAHAIYISTSQSKKIIFFWKILSVFSFLSSFNFTHHFHLEIISLIKCFFSENVLIAHQTYNFI